MSRIQSHEELDVYRLAFDAAMKIFALTKQFPREEIYSLQHPGFYQEAHDDLSLAPQLPSTHAPLHPSSLAPFGGRVQRGDQAGVLLGQIWHHTHWMMEDGQGKGEQGSGGAEGQGSGGEKETRRGEAGKLVFGHVWTVVLYLECPWRLRHEAR